MKLGEDWLNGFWAIEEKPGDGPLCPPPPRVQIEKTLKLTVPWQQLLL